MCRCALAEGEVDARRAGNRMGRHARRLGHLHTIAVGHFSLQPRTGSKEEQLMRCTTPFACRGSAQQVPPALPAPKGPHSHAALGN